MIWPFKRKQTEETRASGTGYTTQVLAARADYITGQSGLAELTGTVQSCVTLWEGGISLADVEGTELLTPSVLSLAARSLALRGEALFVIREDRLIPCSDWDLSTKFSMPTAYRVGIADTGGGKSETVLAGEVLHLRVGSDASMPYVGQAPLRRSQLTAGLLQAVETTLSEVYELAPIGSQVLPFPESPETNLEMLAKGFRRNRGKVLVRESVNVSAAGGPAPILDWKPHDLTPDLQRVMTRDTLADARNSILFAYGILPGFVNLNGNGPMIREGQRHLSQWVLQPIAKMIAQEASEKLGDQIEIDVMRPLQAYDAGGRARAAVGVVQALSAAKEAGVDPALALKIVDWET
ncbi:hypothetical protein AAFO92_13810 [Roseovarius sp. CAU 1744]|uniref:hypothetical protein n=1 Tax=Roseovarius sp. CAU 1744 TaxID=3140368 RepID=UPI00325AA4BD